MALRKPGRTTMRRRSRGNAAKIVVTGPFAAGKTTLIRTISEITVLSTEKSISDETSSRKAETTVAMDFGRISIDSDLVLYLFGTPGQDRFDFMWEVLGDGMLGYLLVIDGDRPESPEEAQSILAAFRKMAKVPFVVAVNRCPDVTDAHADQLRATLGLDDETPILPVDAADKASVKRVMLALLHHALDKIEPVRVGA
jgi:small GTP-binding protein